MTTGPKHHRSLRHPRLPELRGLALWALPGRWSIPSKEIGLALPADPGGMLSRALVKDSESSAPSNHAPCASGDSQIGKSDLIEFAIQTWRLEKRAQSLDPDAFKREYRQFSDSVRRFKNFLARFDVEFKDPAGSAFDTGMRDIDVISWDDADGEEAPGGISGPWIKQTVSPIIIKDGAIIKRGEVVCVDPGEQAS